MPLDEASVVLPGSFFTLILVFYDGRFVKCRGGAKTAGVKAVWYCSFCKKRRSGREDTMFFDLRGAVISEFFKRKGGT